MTKILDPKMRKYLQGYINKTFKDVRVVEELHIGKPVIADMLCINKEHIIGIEIKSDGDNLKRLPKQILYYDKICHYNYVAITEKHKTEIYGVIPEHWGVILIQEERVQLLRESTYHEPLDMVFVFNLLWRREMLDLFKSKGLKQYSALNMRKLTKRALSEIDNKEIEAYVYQCLLERTNWKDTASEPYRRRKRQPRKRKSYQSKVQKSRLNA